MGLGFTTREKFDTQTNYDFEHFWLSPCFIRVNHCYYPINALSYTKLSQDGARSILTLLGSGHQKTA